uniref:Uncharacterized protein n=1 Tax=Nelumbo nucifera TaxID=4432 RepID=A0A822YN36_NELNU|nr:TPA_asm: hypothetical protein HUJ06_012793 [Nelumbo nucifera]
MGCRASKFESGFNNVMPFGLRQPLGRGINAITHRRNTHRNKDDTLSGTLSTKNLLRNGVAEDANNSSSDFVDDHHLHKRDSSPRWKDLELEKVHSSLESDNKNGLADDEVHFVTENNVEIENAEGEVKDGEEEQNEGEERASSVYYDNELAPGSPSFRYFVSFGGSDDFDLGMNTGNSDADGMSEEAKNKIDEKSEGKENIPSICSREGSSTTKSVKKRRGKGFKRALTVKPIAVKNLLYGSCYDPSHSAIHSRKDLHA